MNKKLSLLAVGFMMGLTHFIPGASSATVGVAANIYRETAAAIANIREYFSESIKILLPLCIGTAAAIFLCLTAASHLITAYEGPLRYLFLGAVLGSLPLLVRRFREPALDKWSLIPFACGLLIMLVYYFWTPQIHEITFTRFDAKTFFLLFGSSAFGSAAMLLPGFSSIDMIHLFHADKLYEMIITHHEIFFLLPILCGCIFGFIGTCWVITKTFSQRPQMVYAVLLACFIGSLPSLFGSWSMLQNKPLCLLSAAAGAFLSYWSSSRLNIVPENMKFSGREEQVKEYHIQEYDDGWDD